MHGPLLVEPYRESGVVTPPVYGQVWVGIHTWADQALRRTHRVVVVR